MIEKVFTSYDELGLFLNAKTLSAVLGISRAGTYKLMHEEGFPSVYLGSHIVVPKSDFIEWVESRKNGKR